MQTGALENIAIRIAIWELIEFESVHLTSNKIKLNVILQSRTTQSGICC